MTLAPVRVGFLVAGPRPRLGSLVDTPLLEQKSRAALGSWCLRTRMMQRMPSRTWTVRSACTLGVAEQRQHNRSQSTHCLCWLCRCGVFRACPSSEPCEASQAQVQQSRCGAQYGSAVAVLSSRLQRLTFVLPLRVRVGATVWAQSDDYYKQQEGLKAAQQEGAAAAAAAGAGGAGAGVAAQ